MSQSQTTPEGWRSRRLLPILAIVLLWAAVFAPSFSEYFRAVSNPLLFNNDARQQIWILFPPDSANFVKDDYIRSYYDDAILPAGYRALYWSLSPLIDPATVSKVLPPVLLMFLIGFSALAARRLGGYTAMAATGALVLASGYPLQIMAAALPRAFGLPVFALGVFAVVTQRPGLLGAAVVLGSAVYPPVAMPLAVTLVVLMASGSRFGFLPDYPLRNRIILLVGTALAAGALVFPTWWSAREYGSPVTRETIASFPEAGAGGRYDRENHPPFAGTIEQVDRMASRALRHWLPLLPVKRPGESETRLLIRVLELIALTGLVFLARRTTAGRGLAILLAAVVSGHIAARLFWPIFYFPERQVSATVPVLMWLLLPVAAGELLRVIKRANGERLRLAAMAIVTISSIVLLGGRIEPRAGLDIEIPPERRLYSVLAALPGDALVAGFPKGVVDQVPYVARRSAFVTFETHQAFHTGYILEMRRRTSLLIDAYFASDAAALKRLHEEGVTHLIVERSYLGEAPPSYFEPFNERIRIAHAEGLLNGFQVLRYSGPEVVFREGDVAVLDLSKLVAAEE